MKGTALFELQAVDAVASAGSFRQAATLLGISPSALSHRVATLENQPLMIDAALAGAGLAWVSEAAVAPYLESGALLPVMQEWSPRFAGLRLYYPGHRLVPAGLRMFIDLVHEVMAAPGRRHD